MLFVCISDVLQKRIIQMTTQIKRQARSADRGVRLLARLRQRQLASALAGRHLESRRYHALVNRVRRAMGPTMAAI
ncbi:MAG: hypothetical protein CMJ49_01890 [Planctomycetaceae bacterium]|nr:hypothetical protein [Planctomycetaceae bacterium]